MNLANKVTVLRILLIPIFVGTMFYDLHFLSLVIFSMAVLTDALDGYIARVWKQNTRLGAMLDPVADKLLIITAFLCVLFIKGSGHVDMPPYVPIAVISRDIIIVLGAVLIYMLKGDLEIKPSILGKITTFFQMATIISVLAHFEYSPIIWNVTVLCTVISGLDYVIRGAKILSDN